MKELYNSFQQNKQFLCNYSGIKLGKISSSDKEFHVPITIGQTVPNKVKNRNLKIMKVRRGWIERERERTNKGPTQPEFSTLVVVLRVVRGGRC